MRGGHIAGPDAGRQAITGVVGQRGNLCQIVRGIRHDAQNRSENLFADDAHRRIGVAEHGRFDEIAARAMAMAARVQRGPGGFAFLQIAADPRQLHLGNQRPDLGRAIEPRSDADGAGTGGNPCDHCIMHRLVHDQPRSGHARLARIEKDAGGGAGDHRLDIGIGQHHHRRFAAQFKRNPFQIASRSLDDLAPDIGRSGERDLVDIGMRRQRGAGHFADPGQDIDHARRKARRIDQFTKTQCAQRGFLGGFEHHGTARRQRRGQFHHRHDQREIPRDDLRHHPDRFAHGERLVFAGIADRGADAVQLGRPAGEIAQQFRGHRQIDRARVVQRFAVVKGFQFGQFVGVFEQQVGQPPDQPRPRCPAHARPGAAFERRACRRDGPVNIASARGGDAGDLFTGGGIKHRDRAMIDGRDPCATNQQLVIARQKRCDCGGWLVIRHGLAPWSGHNRTKPRSVMAKRPSHGRRDRQIE